MAGLWLAYCSVTSLVSPSLPLPPSPSPEVSVRYSACGWLVTFPRSHLAHESDHATPHEPPIARTAPIRSALAGHMGKREQLINSGVSVCRRRGGSLHRRLRFASEPIVPRFGDLGHWRMRPTGDRSPSCARSSE